jgi:hypothetical protein
VIVKTCELTGAALDWVVAKCENFREGSAIICVWNNLVTKIIPGDHETSEVYTSYSPSTNWKLGGPIIEREGISLIRQTPDRWVSEYSNGCDRIDHARSWGPTPLIAAMRCYVASKFGDNVEIPDDLML